jgi:hypothetical protein
LEEVKQKLAALEDRMGPDAFSSPEAKELLERLSAIPSDSPDYAEASTLAGIVRAKMRIAQQALSDEPRRDDRPIPRSYGPKENSGAPPTTKDAIHLAESTRVGDSREDLLARYGSCLVRQTWFKGQNGRPSTELFQTSPDCRDRLKPRIFRVADSRIEDVSTGEADAVMKARPRNETRSTSGG